MNQKSDSLHQCRAILLYYNIIFNPARRPGRNGSAADCATKQIKITPN